jgi:hypothetical protein
MNLTRTLLCLAAALPACVAQAQDFTLANAQVKATLSLKDGHLAGERLEVLPTWALAKGPGTALETDGNILVEVVWNDWQAPGKANNGDVLSRFRAADFKFKSQTQRTEGSDQILSLVFDGPSDLNLEVQYTLGAKANYLRKRLRVFEGVHKQYSSNVDSPTGHLLQALYPVDALLKDTVKVQKAGGFGQPVALEVGGGGAFAGLEWPAADISIAADGGRQRLRAGQDLGEAIDFKGVWGESAVLAVTPDPYVKLWFGRYCDDIRVVKRRPYTLYNSWYDLRSAEYPRVKPHQVMNEENVLRIAKLVRENMVEKHGITMDAFMLDDGWDVYKSPWDLRKAQFPNGLAPIVAELKKTNTRLGLWFGPTGGYSMHDWRTDWWKANGYEVTASNHGSIAGEKYSELFKTRVTDFAKEGVAYYKWDGIQFVDNDPAHGQIGLYSRRRAMKNLMGFATATRKVNPDMFLNITSGTWLSPWWMQTADQIWMDGGDFGAADVPSISTRDSSITYRDMVLFEDFKTKDLWFPVSNLMTHGILKGHIDVEHIGKGEPLTKFADEVGFYLARGVTMYELYIAPDIMNPGEWTVLSDSLKWARANFDLLKDGEMVGGDPGHSEPYAFVHYQGEKGILAARNPDIRDQRISLKLDPAHGLDGKAQELVLERIFPTRWVSPRLYKAGETVDLDLRGYEAAIYELKPLKGEQQPLLAGVVFEGEGRERLALDVQPGAKVLNPSALKGLKADGKALDAAALGSLKATSAPWVKEASVKGSGAAFEARFTLDASSRQATLGVLLKPTTAVPEAEDAAPAFTLDGQPVKADKVDAKGVWAWYTVAATPGTHVLQVQVAAPKGKTAWQGSAQVWLAGTQAVNGVKLDVKAKAKAEPRPLPSTGRGAGELPRSVKVGETAVQF